jgi:hypothetical protein
MACGRARLMADDLSVICGLGGTSATVRFALG